jgi:hypothetical protein
LREQGCLTNADMVTMMAGNYHAQGATTYMEIGIVKNLLSEINQEDYRSLEG